MGEGAAAYNGRLRSMSISDVLSAHRSALSFLQPREGHPATVAGNPLPGASTIRSQGPDRRATMAMPTRVVHHWLWKPSVSGKGWGQHVLQRKEVARRAARQAPSAPAPSLQRFTQASGHPTARRAWGLGCCRVPHDRSAYACQSAGQRAADAAGSVTMLCVDDPARAMATSSFARRGSVQGVFTLVLPRQTATSPIRSAAGDSQQRSLSNVSWQLVVRHSVWSDRCVVGMGGRFSDGARHLVGALDTHVGCLRF